MTANASESVMAQAWQPESPFLNDPVVHEQVASHVSPSTAFGKFVPQSPFLSEYTQDGESAPGPQAEMFASLMAEFHDEEFGDALAELADEASALVEDRFSYETGDPTRQAADAEGAVRDYLAPLEREATDYISRLEAAVSSNNVEQLTEGELEAFLDRFDSEATMSSPTFENFLKKLAKKVKKVAKKAAKLASRVLPHAIIFRKLKPLIKPLLDKVLRAAIDKLPAAVRPAAMTLASSLLGIKLPANAAADSGADSAAATDALQAAPDVSDAQEEFDARLAGQLVRSELTEAELGAMEFASEQEAPEGLSLQELEQARTEFARAVVNLRPGEDAGPVVQNFLPAAVLPVLKMGIKIVGRPKVVTFLADLVAKLISKHVGKEAAASLSRALVDTGLRLLTLEASPEQANLAAGYTLASTIEDTMQRLTEAPPEVWQSELAMEAFVNEAFNRAALASFPDSGIRPELREAARENGAWVLMPQKGRRKRYKKYTRVIETNLTPQMAAAVTSFGETPLANVFKDQLGMPGSANIDARVHLYEAVPGTTLPRIAMHEKGVAGLGGHRPEAWSQIHPLTPQAAATLFQEPGLAAEVEAEFLQDPRKTKVGQRFYYLEIPNARVRAIVRALRKRKKASAQAAQPAAASEWESEQSEYETGQARAVAEIPRTSRTSAVFDFPGRQLRLFLYFSEAEAQNIAKAINARAPAPAILQVLAAGRGRQLKSLLSGVSSRRLRVIHEAVPVDQFKSPAAGRLFKLLGNDLARVAKGWLVGGLKSWLEKQFDKFAGDFARAAEDGADGVTLALVFQAPPIFESIRKAMSGGAVSFGGVFDALKGGASLPSFSVQVSSGFQRG